MEITLLFITSLLHLSHSAKPFFVEDVGIKWNAAKAGCEALGTSLVTLGDSEDGSICLDSFTAQELSVNIRVWIGAYYAGSSGWIWTEDGTSVDTDDLNLDPRDTNINTANNVMIINQKMLIRDRLKTKTTNIRGYCCNAIPEPEPFFVSAPRVNWNVAKRGCEALGTSLVTLGDSEDGSICLSSFSAEELSVNIRVWIGAYYGGSSNGWLWAEDGSSVNTNDLNLDPRDIGNIDRANNVMVINQKMFIRDRVKTKLTNIYGYCCNGVSISAANQAKNNDELSDASNVDIIESADDGNNNYAVYGVSALIVISLIIIICIVSFFFVRRKRQNENNKHEKVVELSDIATVCDDGIDGDIEQTLKE